MFQVTNPLHHRRQIGLIFLLAVMAVSLGASVWTEDLSSHRFNIREWHMANGLPQNLITALARTPDGYLWLGSQEGLVRFNSREFQVFNRRNVPEFTDNHIVDLQVGPQGKLWIGTNGGGVLVFHRGAFSRPAPGSELDGAAVTSLCVGTGGLVWVATADMGLLILDPARDRVTRPPVPELRNTQVDCVFEDSRGILWVAQPGRLWRGTLRALAPVDFALPGKTTINAIAEGVEGKIWIATAGAGLFRGTHEGFTRMQSRGSRALNSANCLLCLTSGDMAAGTDSGMVRFSASGDDAVLPDIRELSGLAVNDLAQDMEGGLWLATYTGLVQVLPARMRILDPVDGLPDAFTWAVYEDPDGDLWIGFRSGGLVRLSPEGRIRRYTSDDGLPEGEVRCIMQDREGDLWVGTSNGLARRRQQEWQRYSVADGLSHPVVRAVFQDSSGRIWIGTNNGINRLGGGGKLETVSFSGSSSPEYVFAFHEDREGVLWIAAGNGVWRIRNGRLGRFGVGSDLEDLRVFSVYSEGSRNVWIGTHGLGLCHWDGADFTWYSSTEGLLDNVIFRIIPDSKGNFWMSSNRGIMAVSRRQLADLAAGKIRRLSPQQFGFDPGRSVLECTGGSQSSGLITRDGIIAVPTIHGLVMIDPRRAEPPEYTPPVQVEALIAGGVEHPPRSGLVLAPGTRNLEFRFVALAFSPAVSIQYRYRLEGYDGEWREVGERTRAYYTHLSPGNHVFRVNSTRYNGAWSNQEAMLRFSIQPFFFQTWWFRILVALVLAGMVVLIFRLRVRALMRHKAELERMVAEQTHRLKELSLRDPLTGVLNRRFITEVACRDARAFIQYKQYLLSGHGRVRRQDPPEAVFGIFLFDIDHFKTVNDRFGHHAGDRLLRDFAGILEDSVRGDDVVVRWGGEEFLVILKRTLPAYLDTYARKMLSRVGDHPFHPAAEGDSLKVTCSIGCCPFPLLAGVPDLIDLDEAIRLADAAMYVAKRTGRDRAVAVTHVRGGKAGGARLLAALRSGVPLERISGVKFHPLEGFRDDSAK